MSFKSLVITFIFFAGMSAAQENPNLCLSLVGDAERLECYDKYFKAQLQDERGEDAADPEIGTEIYKYERAKEFTLKSDLPALLIYVQKFNLTEDQKNQLTPEVEAVVKPLPAAKAELNLIGYQILSYLNPGNDNYVTKMKRYEIAVINNKTKFFKKLKARTDQFKGVTWYSHPTEPAYRNSRSTIYAYIGKRNGGSPFLRLVTQYKSDSWLFVEKVQVSVDGKVSTLTVADGYRFEGDNGYGGIWEWQDESMSATQLSIAKQIGGAKKVTIRYEGSQYYSERQMPSKDITAMKEVLLAYQEMLDNNI